MTDDELSVRVLGGCGTTIKPDLKSGLFDTRYKRTTSNRIDAKAIGRDITEHDTGECLDTSKYLPWRTKFYAAFETLDTPNSSSIT